MTVSAPATPATTPVTPIPCALQHPPVNVYAIDLRTGDGITVDSLLEALGATSPQYIKRVTHDFHNHNATTLTVKSFYLYDTSLELVLCESDGTYLLDHNAVLACVHGRATWRQLADYIATLDEEVLDTHADIGMLRTCGISMINDE